jgi:hypothetical protein
MAVAQGYGKTVTSGSVFAYDVADTRNSYIGEPTTNVLYSYDPFLVSQITWTNSGEWTVNSNETDIEKPTIPGVNTNSLRILSGRTTTVGSQHIGCAFSGTTLSPSTTYTISIWFRQNRAGSNQPYFRTNVNNNSMGNFNYNGNTDASTWPVNQWIKISATATIQANENGIYLSNYIGSQVDDKVWYFAAQIEAKNHATSLALGTRSSTQGLLPLVGNSTLDLSNVSFDSNAQMTFDGTNDYILKSPRKQYTVAEPWTIELVFKPTTTTGYWNALFGGTLNTGGYWMFHGNGTLTYYQGSSGEVGTKINYLPWDFSNTFTQGVFHHLTICYSPASPTTGVLTLYYNGGQKVHNFTETFVWTYSLDIQFIGAGDSRFGTNDIHCFKEYNRALSAAEVRQNYLHYKTRFNLS